MKKGTHNTTCRSCGAPKPLTSFYASNQLHHDGYLPFCKGCLQFIYKNNLDKTNSEAVATWCTCMEIGYPFFLSSFEEAKRECEDKKKAGKTANMMQSYIPSLKIKLANAGIELLGVEQSDTALEELTSETFGVAGVYTDSIPQEELERVWGYFDEHAAYVFLEEQFERYTGQLKSLPPAQEDLYRELCVNLWRKRKLTDEGEFDEKVMKDLRAETLSLMKVLKIDRFEDTTEKDERLLFIERLAWQHENVSPAECEDLEKYKDFCGIGKAYEQLMRPFRNLIAGTREYPKVNKGD